MLFGAHRAGCCCGEDRCSSIGCVRAALTRRKRQIIFSKPIAAGSQSSSLQSAVLGSVCRIAYETLAVQMCAFVVSLTRTRGVASEGALYRSPPRDQGAPPNFVSCVDLEESYTSHCDGTPVPPRTVRIPVIERIVANRRLDSPKSYSDMVLQKQYNHKRGAGTILIEWKYHLLLSYESQKMDCQGSC